MADRKVSVQCPSCLKWREIARKYATCNNRKQRPMYCAGCSRKRLPAEAKKGTNQFSAIQIYPDSAQVPCGTIKRAKAGRCDEASKNVDERCVHYLACLDIAAERMWGGWRSCKEICSPEKDTE